MDRSLFTRFAGACNSPKFFGLGTWYKYVPTTTDFYGNCKLDIAGLSNAYWLIALGIVDIMLRIAGLVAIAYVIYGGFKYITSQGNPENTKGAQRTIVNALIGVAIVTVSVELVSFIAGKL